MLEAGLPIVKGLETLAMQQKNIYFKEVITDLKRKVEAGMALSEGMSEYPKIFGNLYLQMVRSGEQSGNLDIVLKRLANYLEKIVALKSKIKHAMIYPSVIVFVTIVVVSIIMFFVIPKFAELFKEAGQSLPLPTQILINISQNFKSIFFFFVVFIIASVIGIKYYRKSEKGRYNTDKILLRLPLLGELFHKAAISRIARTLANLIGAGVPLLQALTIAGKPRAIKFLKRQWKIQELMFQQGTPLLIPCFSPVSSLYGN